MKTLTCPCTLQANDTSVYKYVTRKSLTRNTNSPKFCEWHKIQLNSGHTNITSNCLNMLDMKMGCKQHNNGLDMNSMNFVIPLHSWYWSIHTKDESKHGTAFAFIFCVNWLWHCGFTASFGVFFHEIKCNGMTRFLEFMWRAIRFWKYPSKDVLKDFKMSWGYYPLSRASLKSQ